MVKATQILVLITVTATQCYSSPGGYVGLGIQYGTNKTIGLQVSYGIALPSVGEPGVGPYLFPGIAVGRRYSLNDKKRYSYSDLQILYMNGFWVGSGFGLMYKSGQLVPRAKVFAGYLIGGYTHDIVISSKPERLFKGWHLGIALPVLGSHIQP